MTSATSSILIITGAVLAFAVSYSADAIYIQSIGGIVMVIGGLGLAASILKPTRLLAHAHNGSPTLALQVQPLGSDTAGLSDQDRAANRMR